MMMPTYGGSPGAFTRLFSSTGRRGAEVALFAGLMSGTSLDGIDVALVEMAGEAERPEASRLLGFRTVSYDLDLRERLQAASEGNSRPSELCVLNFELGRLFAAAVSATCREHGVPADRLTAIGSHGHTVWHQPPRNRQPGATLQLGEAAVLAERLGVPVVADFRVRDMAAGGHGAPLTPYFDRLLLSVPDRARAIQNIGGMANLTALPRADAPGQPLAFDTGPGVALIDAAVRLRTKGRTDIDRDGALAAAGEVDVRALAEWLSDPFFQLPPPKSTGRERFGALRLQEWLARHPQMSTEDTLATLTELTARTIFDSYRWVPFELEEVYVCGGGVRNGELLRRLRHHLSPRTVQSLDALGWNADAREAAAFALLARQHLLGIAAGPAWATGARGPRVLGKLVPPG